MTKTISQVGDWQGIIFDAAFMERARLKAGDLVNVELHHGGTITLTPIRPIIKPKPAAVTARRLIRQNSELSKQLRMKTGMGTVTGATHHASFAGRGFGIVGHGVVLERDCVGVCLPGVEPHALVVACAHAGMVSCRQDEHGRDGVGHDGFSVAVSHTLHRGRSGHDRRVFMTLGGRTEVMIRNGEGVVYTGLGWLGRRKRFNPEFVKQVGIEDKRGQDSDGDRRGSKRIVIETQDGKPIKFGSTLTAERMKFVAAALRKALKS